MNCSYALNQSVYMPGHSVESTLLTVTDRVMNSFDKNEGVRSFTRPFNAFDTLDHTIVVVRTSTFGIQTLS